MGATEQTIQLLTEIRDELRAIRAAGSGVASASGSSVAPDSDLDGQYGDPEVTKDPKRYQGPPMAPRRMSEGTPEWLDAVAEFKEWQAGKAEAAHETTASGKPKADYMRRDAARARGWAKRLRSGWRRVVTDCYDDGTGANEAEAEAMASATDGGW